MLNGIICINKPEGFTSFDVIAKMRGILKMKKLGYSGTLDPMATGVLPVFAGGATKAISLVPETGKSYRAGFRLGVVTDTYDTSGKILEEKEFSINKETVEQALVSFRGEITQLPPMYSAVQVNGKRLYDLARKGMTVERQPRPITIHSLRVTETEDKREYILDVHCSGGTYIRTLCADIGNSLGCGGAMAALERTEAFGFDITESCSIDFLRECVNGKLTELLIPTERLFEELPKVRLSAFNERLFRGGCEIYQKKISTGFEVGTRVRLEGKSGFFALGEVIPPEKCKDTTLGSAIKSIKLFDV